MRDNTLMPQQGARSSVLVRRLVRDFIWRHWPRIALAFFCMALAGGSTALRAWLMEPVLDRIFIARDSSLLLLLAGAALALALVKAAADYAQSIQMSRVGQRVITDVQGALFARLIRADLAYFNANPSGVLISRLMNDVWLLRRRTTWLTIWRATLRTTWAKALAPLVPLRWLSRWRLWWLHLPLLRRWRRRRLLHLRRSWPDDVRLLWRRTTWLATRLATWRATRRTAGCHAAFLALARRR